MADLTASKSTPYVYNYVPEEAGKKGGQTICLSDPAVATVFSSFISSHTVIQDLKTAWRQ